MHMNMCIVRALVRMATVACACAAAHARAPGWVGSDSVTVTCQGQGPLKYPINNVGCRGLEHDERLNASQCEQQCCADKTCFTWEYSGARARGDDTGGCWLGNLACTGGGSEGWVGSSKVPVNQGPPSPSPPRPPTGTVPLPTRAQLLYQQRELVALTHFNMATFYRDGDPACDASNWNTSKEPSSFAPTNMNVSNWIENYQAVGVKSGILTAKHGCGFLLWPTNVTLPGGANYGYHVAGKGGIGIDVAKLFQERMVEAGMPHSFYYSLKDSFYLNAIGDNVRAPSTLLPGQVNVTQQQFEDVSVAAVTELWSKYGQLAEIWFDGGISDRIKSRIVPLLQTLQPDAVTFGAGIGNDLNEVDWIGTESGVRLFAIIIQFKSHHNQIAGAAYRVAVKLGCGLYVS